MGYSKVKIFEKITMNLKTYIKNLFLLGWFIMLSTPSLAQEPKKILVVDGIHIDEMSDRFDKYDDILSKKGFRIDITNNVNEAIVRWLLLQPDIVFLNMEILINHPIKIRSYVIDKEGGLKILLRVLQIEPTDVAKVILTSDTRMGLLPPEVKNLIDHNLDEKFDPEKHSQLLQELLDNNQEPKRKSYLPQFEETPSNLWMIQQLQKILQEMRTILQEMRTKVYYEPNTIISDLLSEDKAKRLYENQKQYQLSDFLHFYGEMKSTLYTFHRRIQIAEIKALSKSQSQENPSSLSQSQTQEKQNPQNPRSLISRCFNVFR